LIPNIADYQSYMLPLSIPTVNAEDILVIKLSTTAPSGNQHRLDFAANTTATDPLSYTYLTSAGCNLETPVNLLQLGDGFEQQIVMNLYVAENRGLVYNWGGAVDDPTSPRPLANPQGLETTYPVTITDEACDLTFTDEVVLTCDFASSVEELAKTKVQILPNPNNGWFQINTGNLKPMDFRLMDGQGRLLFSEAGISDGQSFDFGHLAKGLYWVQLAREGEREIHKIIIQ